MGKWTVCRYRCDVETDICYVSGHSIICTALDQGLIQLGMSLFLHEAKVGFRDVDACCSECFGTLSLSLIEIPRGELVDLHRAQPEQTGLRSAGHVRYDACMH